jgi:hypothetical protein
MNRRAFATLSNVVGNIDSNHTSETSHQKMKISENVPSVPGFPVSRFPYPPKLHLRYLNSCQIDPAVLVKLQVQNRVV